MIFAGGNNVPTASVPNKTAMCRNNNSRRHPITQRIFARADPALPKKTKAVQLSGFQNAWPKMT